jgi:hypothetical protein
MSEFERLMGAWLDCESTDEDVGQLQDQLRGNPGRVREFAEQVMLHHLLRKARVLESPLPLAIEGASDRVTVGRVRNARVSGRWLSAAITGAVAAVLLLGIPLLFRQGLSGKGLSQSAADRGTSPTRPTAIASAARFTRTESAIWSTAARRWKGGDVLGGGDVVDLARGRVELVFDSAAVMTLVGPAALEVESATAASLRSGSATTRVENGAARRFRMSTPTTQVVDLGTEFGIAVSPSGETEVVVFDGAVELEGHDESPLGGGASGHRLAMGEGARIDHSGARVRIPMIWQDPAVPMWSTGESRPGTSLIAAVRDNLSNGSPPKFYAIVPGGFREDAKAYVDRDHEWNGLDGQGLPAELRGGDYIRTFNDDKFRDDIEIVVTLARRAIFYVLFYDGLPAPDWLSSEFVDTGLKVGMDDGDYLRSGGELVRRPLDVGAGKSIDCRYCVWKRTLRGASDVRLGPICNREERETLTDQAMYGIVVMPLEESASQ